MGKGSRVKLVRILTVVFLVLLATACTASIGQQKDGAAIQASSNLKELSLEVSTITCTGCWPRVGASARSVSGVLDVRFDQDRIQKVTIVYDAAQTNPAAIIAAIEKRGDRVVENSERIEQGP